MKLNTYYRDSQINTDGECSTHGKMRNMRKISAGKTEGKRPLGRSRYRWR